MLEFGFITSPETTEDHDATFSRLFAAWKVTNQRYIEKASGPEKYDLPYYYNERAGVSMLAGAAWLANMIVLEEYVTKKSVEAQSDEKFSGRGDLYIGDNGKHYCLEAKQLWINLDNEEKTTSDKIECLLDEACNDASKSIWKNCKNVGLVLITPHTKDKDTNKVTERFNNLVMLTKTCFHSRTLRFPSYISWIRVNEYEKTAGSDGRFWPGTIAMVELL